MTSNSDSRPLYGVSPFSFFGLQVVIAEARGLPLALGPDSRFCDGLVEAGIVKRIDIGSKVMALETKDYGVVTG